MSQTGAINVTVHATMFLLEFFATNIADPLDPKLTFLCLSFRSRAFGTVLLLHETCCKMRQTGAINAKVRAMMS
jgi:hypothetical protein